MGIFSQVVLFTVYPTASTQTLFRIIFRDFGLSATLFPSAASNYNVAHPEQMMMIRQTNALVLACIGIVVSLGTTTIARSTEVGSIDSYVTAQMKERGIPGMAVAVIRRGKIEKASAYGKASLEFDLPMKITTPFSIASITKSVTSVAVMALIEAGKIQLDDPIGATLQGLPQSWQSVTVRQLLSHTSGLPDINVDSYTTTTIASTTDDAIRILKDRSFDFPSGTSYAYNQTNYMLLGMLIAALSGKSYEEYCIERLFKPFKLKSVAFGDSRTVVTNRATTYTPYRYGAGPPKRLDRAEILSAEFPSMSNPGGGLNISVEDFAGWLKALLSGRIIREENLKEIWKPIQLKDGSTYQRPASSSIWTEYGLGWVERIDGPHPFVGGTGGIRSAFFVYPNDDLAVIVLTNWQGARPESLVEGIARFYF